MADNEGKHEGGLLHKPSMDSFVFEGESTPLLFQKRVIGSIVLVFLALVGGYFAASAIFGFSTTFDAEPFREWVDDFGVFGPIVFIAILALSVLFAPIPNVPIFIAAGLAWGPVVGTIYSMIGMMIGSVMAFYTARWLGRRHLPRLVGAKMAQRMDAIAGTMGGKVIFWSRMLPAVNFDWISFVAGVTAIRFLPFIVATFFGMLLPTTVGVVAGDGLGSDFRITIAAGAFWLFGIVVSALYFWRRRRKWKAERSANGSTAVTGEAAKDTA